MRRFGDLRFDNCVAACWSCNTLKAHWPPKVFQGELASLASAVISRADRKQSGTASPVQPGGRETGELVEGIHL